jgi:sugar phosphate isomerase/epimerase
VNPKLKLGFDNFALRSLGWKATRLLDYAAQQRLDAILFSDLDVFESRSDSALRELRARAADWGVALYVGTLSVCPTSVIFKPERGTAEEQLRETIRVAHALGSPVARVVLGNWKDRLSPGGIRARIADLVGVLKACRSPAVDAGLKIAVENHAGDLRATELLDLLDAAGADFTGATMDAGNAAWALEDPRENLERLGPRALCTGIRDSTAWETPGGATLQWMAMGEGSVDWCDYFRRYAELCPETPVFLETISGRQFPLSFQPDDLRAAYPELRPEELASYRRFVQRGRPQPPVNPPDLALDPAFQRAELEKSLRYCREVLGLGRKR